MNKKKFKHILITGGAGYVGVPTVSLLLEKGYKVTVIDNLMWTGNVLLPFLSNTGFNFIKGDIRSKKELTDSFEDIDIVIHLAAIVGFPACRKYPKESREINVDGTQHVVDFAKGKIPIIFASTGSTYGKIIEKYCTETTPLNPLSHYGKQKAEAEDIIKTNDSFIIYRFATAFGVSPRMRLDLLINDFAFRAVSEKTLIVYEKEFMRTFIHVKDMARSFLFALENFDKMNKEIYNVGDERLNVSKEEVCRLLQKYVEFYLHFVEVGHDIDQRDYMVDYSKIQKVGYDTTISIEEGIKELIKLSDIIKIENPYSNV
ncbi:NAD-dependent epimerase/dehydratase [Candidatus Daviesbacteria bacterium]|nr:NAD-dependent epimerase/dehydratase [Candidatus Daviesbacteria bacterium]